MWKSQRRDKLKNRTAKAFSSLSFPLGKHKYLCKRIARDKTFLSLFFPDKMNVSHLSGIFHLSTNYPWLVLLPFSVLFSTYLFNRFHVDGAERNPLQFYFIQFPPS
jgi:hypothetical protein